MTDITIEHFGAIVGEIYDCALDPARWPGVLERLCDALGAESALLGVSHPMEVRFIFEAQVRADPAYLQLFNERYAAIGPFAVASHFFKAGDIISVEDAVDYDEFLQTRFYKEWAAPQGWSDNIVGILTQNAHSQAFIAFSLRHRVRHEKAVLAAFLPHLERAVRISDALAFRTTQAAELAAVVDGLSTGVILVDAELAVWAINPAAGRQLGELRGLGLEAGRLAVPRTAAGAELRAAIAACAEGRPDALGDATMLFEGADGSLGLVGHVLPLPRWRGAGQPEPVAAVFLTTPAAPGRTPVEALVRRFGLTPSETRVLLGLLSGQSPRAIADAHGIGIATIRTHLRRLYDKTGTRGQVDLVQLVARLGGVP